MQLFKFHLRPKGILLRSACITISNTFYFVLFILSSVSSVRQSSVAGNIIYLDNLTVQQGKFQLAENLLI